MKKIRNHQCGVNESTYLLRHGHMITICDQVFLYQKRREDIIDLSLTAGIPSFFDTLKAVLNEIIVEKFIVVDHMEIYNPRRVYNRFKKIMIKAGTGKSGF